MMNVDEVCKFLENKFLDCDKVEYHNELGGYWNVIYYNDEGLRSDCYKFLDGELKFFNSIEYSDEEEYEEE